MMAASPHLANISDADRQRLEPWLIEFDRHWKQEALGKWAARLPARGRLRTAALVEMIKIDLERQWQNGRQPGVESYLGDYPEIAVAGRVPLPLILAEYEVRRDLGLAPELSEFARRFPEQNAEFLGLLAESPRSQTPVATPAAQHETQSVHGGTTSSGHARERLSSLPAEFGRYRVERPLGEGGMGAVYLAEDTQLGRRVALKVPHFPKDGTAEVIRRFQREARAAATLQHPNICPVFDVGELDGIHYLTMAFIDGQPLAQILNRIAGAKPLPERQAALVVRKVALALSEAHRHGVVHRDLKPANIMIDSRREPIIMDFGLARIEGQDASRLTHSGAIIGTPAYMSPEQVHAEPGQIGPATDIYSLGVILYELLAGRLPFAGSLASVLGQIVAVEPEPPLKHRPDLDSRLDEICMKAMAKNIGSRYGSMKEFADALTDYLKSPPPQTPAARAAVEPANDAFEQLFAGVVVDSAPQASRILRRQERIPWWGWLLLTLLPLAMLAVTIFVQTNHGTIKIELSDPNAEVIITVDGKTIDIRNIEKPLQLKPGPHGLKVTGEGFETITKEFTVKRGQNPAVRVTLVPKAMERAIPDSKHEPGRNSEPADADRDVAAWVLRNGGVVELAGQEVPIRRLADIPNEPFHVESISFPPTQAEFPHPIRDDDLERLRALTGLQTLHLANTRVTGNGLRHIRGIKTLRDLSLWGSPVGDDGLVHLKNLDDLIVLRLSSLITDSGLEHLKGLQRLEYLHLGRSQKVTDAGLEHLNGLTNLRTLNVGNTQVTAARASELQAVLPNCEIEHLRMPTQEEGRQP